MGEISGIKISVLSEEQTILGRHQRYSILNFSLLRLPQEIIPNFRSASVALKWC